MKKKSLSMLLALVLALSLVLVPAYAAESESESALDTAAESLEDLDLSSLTESLEEAFENLDLSNLTDTDLSEILDSLEEALQDLDLSDATDEDSLIDTIKSALEDALDELDLPDLSEEDEDSLLDQLKDALDEAMEELDLDLEDLDLSDLTDSDLSELMDKILDAFKEAVEEEETDTPDDSTEEDHSAVCPSAKFADVDTSEDSWYHEGVDYALEKGYMVGTSDTTFEPDTDVTRAQLVQILYAKEGRPDADDADFSDVDADAWYADAVSWAADNGIVAGYPDGTFKPDQSLTREELATILYAYTSYKGYDTEASGDLSAFSDADDTSDYAENAMSWAVGHSMIAGTDQGLEPQGVSTRAQIAVILKAYDANIAE